MVEAFIPGWKYNNVPAKTLHYVTVIGSKDDLLCKELAIVAMLQATFGAGFS